MKLRLHKLLLLVALATVAGGRAPARAQITPDLKSYGVFERGVLVGEILRTDTTAERYTEHWVLYPGYVYPSSSNGVVVEIRPGSTEYRDLTDFFRRVPFATGSRYVRTDCVDGTSLPTR